MVGKWSEMTREAFVPEQHIHDHSCAVDIGYAKSKRVCEVIIEQVMEEQKFKSVMTLPHRS